MIFKPSRAFVQWATLFCKSATKFQTVPHFFTSQVADSGSSPTHQSAAAQVEHASRYIRDIRRPKPRNGFLPFATKRRNPVIGDCALIGGRAQDAEKAEDGPFNDFPDRSGFRFVVEGCYECADDEQAD